MCVDIWDWDLDNFLIIKPINYETSKWTNYYFHMFYSLCLLEALAETGCD